MMQMNDTDIVSLRNKNKFYVHEKRGEQIVAYIKLFRSGHQHFFNCMEVSINHLESSNYKNGRHLLVDLEAASLKVSSRSHNSFTVCSIIKWCYLGLTYKTYDESPMNSNFFLFSEHTQGFYIFLPKFQLHIKMT